MVILIDSVAAIRRLKQQLTWFRRKDFRPHTRRTKDFDVVQEIFLSLDERGRNGAHTTMVKVHGHTGEPLHAVRMQCQRREPTGKWKSMTPETTNLIFVFKGGENGREDKGIPRVKSRIREHEAERKWDKRSAGTWAEKFHSREGAVRQELGEARQRCGDWAVTVWIRSLTQCDTPHCYLVARTYKKWRMKMDDSCLCGEGAGTVLHMQLACKLKSRRAAIQGAHDDVMRVMEEEVMREVPPGRRAIMAIPYTGLLIAASCKSRSSHGQYTRSSTEHLSYGTYLPQGIYGARPLSQRVRGGRLAHFCT